MTSISTPIDSGYKYILAYGIAIALFIVVIKSKAGYAAMYYVLVLSLLYLMLTEGKFIAQAVLPITQQATS